MSFRHSQPSCPWTRRDSTVEHQTRWFTVRHDSVIRPDGSPGIYVHVVSPGSVTVLALDDGDRVMLTRQWVYTHSSTEWRLPGGGIDGTDPDSASAAQRELAEETGLTAARWELLGQVHEADSLSNHVDTVYLATGLARCRRSLEPGEYDLELHWIPFDQALGLVVSGEMRHAGSAYAVLRLAAAGRPCRGRRRPPPSTGR